MKVAVAVPLRDEEASVEALIDSLLGQSRPPDEIVVADGGSRDRTVELIQARIDRGQPINLVQIGPAFPGRGRNEAVKASRSEWIAFTDGGIRAERNWLERMCGYVEQHPQTNLVLGNFEPVAPTFFTKCAALAYVPLRQQEERTRGWRGRSIASCLVKRAIWEQVGGFPEHLRSAEDLVFLEAIEAITDEIGIVPDATVHWEIQPNIERTLRRFRTYARYDLLAGRYKNWHRALVNRYAVITALSAATGPAAPMTFSALTLALLSARSLRSMKRKPEFVEPSVKDKALQFAATAGILGLLDYAAFRGMASWVWHDIVEKKLQA